MVTMDQVAARAKVSQTTVSHVLGGNADRLRISLRTRQRVLNAAQELGYHRNMLARAMGTGKSRVIGLLTNLDFRENIVQIQAGAMEAGNDNDYILKVIHLPYHDLANAAVTRCLEWRIVGAMVFGLSDVTQRHLNEEFQREQIPLAIVDSAPLSKWGMRFVSDDAHGIGQVLAHLVGLGHRRIGFLGGGESELSERRERFFRTAMTEAELPLPSYWVRNTAWGNCKLIAEGAHAMLREDRPTAIVCSSDTIATVVIREANLLGLQVPQDLSVTGYSNASLGEYAYPPLTTVSQPFQEMGHAAARHLIQCAEGEDVNPSIGPRPDVLLPTRLIERASTAPPFF